MFSTFKECFKPVYSCIDLLAWIMLYVVIDVTVGMGNIQFSISDATWGATLPVVFAWVVYLAFGLTGSYFKFKCGGALPYLSAV